MGSAGGFRGGIRGRGAGAQWGSCSSPKTGGGAITIPRGQGGAAESSAGVVPGYPPNASSAGCCPGWPGAVLGGAWCGGVFPAGLPLMLPQRGTGRGGESWSPSGVAGTLV